MLYCLLRKCGMTVSPYSAYQCRRGYEHRTGETVSFHRFVEMLTVKWQHVYQVLNITEIVIQQTWNKAAEHDH